MTFTEQDKLDIFRMLDKRVKREDIAFAYGVTPADLREIYKDWLLNVSKLPDSDTLDRDLRALYDALPDSFQRSEAVKVCKSLRLSSNKFEVAMRRKDFSSLFIRLKQGYYCKAIASPDNSTE